MYEIAVFLDQIYKPMNLQTDVCIVGAGPGGAAAALKLSYLGIPCVLLDKATFPRDKICGDAISGKVTTLLNRLDPEILARFRGEPMQVDVWGIKFVAPNLKELDIPFRPNYVREVATAPGHVSKRMDFDHFLIKEVEKRDNIRFFQNVHVEDYERTEQGFQVRTKDGSFQLDTRILLVADGANSSFARKQAGLKKDLKHQAGAIRAYYKNVTGMSKDNFLELHFIRELVPGYFWIFPLPNGQANVGLGMRSDIIKKRKVNLRAELDRIIATHPVMKERFRNAELLGSIRGFGLPLGSKRRPRSGDHYMLLGDAGHLVDPVSGEGIGNAFYSGFVAAEQAQQCLEQNNFSAAFMQDYDVRVDRIMGKEMRLSYKLQKMLSYRFLVNIMANIIANNQNIINFFANMYNDFALREQLVRPFFWLKMWVGKSKVISHKSKVESRKS